MVSSSDAVTSHWPRIATSLTQAWCAALLNKGRISTIWWGEGERRALTFFIISWSVSQNKFLVGTNNKVYNWCHSATIIKLPSEDQQTKKKTEKDEIKHGEWMRQLLLFRVGFGFFRKTPLTYSMMMTGSTGLDILKLNWRLFHLKTYSDNWEL